MAEHVSKRVSTAYAQALLEAAAGANAAAGVRADVESLQELLRHYPDYGRFLADPKVDLDRREQMIRCAFERRVHPLTLNFLLVLNRRWRLGSLGSVLAAYIDMDDRRRLGRRDVEVTSAVALDEPLLEQVKRSIAAWGGFEPVLRVRQDASLLGGLMVRIGDRQMDASVRGQLEQLRGQLKKRFQARGGEAATQEA